MKKGDEVRCKRELLFVTKGKKYKVLEVNNTEIRILDDFFVNTFWYPKEHFEPANKEDLRDRIAKIIGYCPYDIQQEKLFRPYRDYPCEMDKKVNETLKIINELVKEKLTSMINILNLEEE